MFFVVATLMSFFELPLERQKEINVEKGEEI
jgi:hypothetical protein